MAERGGETDRQRPYKTIKGWQRTTAELRCTPRDVNQIRSYNSTATARTRREERSDAPKAGPGKEAPDDFYVIQISARLARCLTERTNEVWSTYVFYPCDPSSTTCMISRNQALTSAVTLGVPIPTPERHQSGDTLRVLASKPRTGCCYCCCRRTGSESERQPVDWGEGWCEEGRPRTDA